MRVSAYPDVECLESIAGRCPQWHQFGAGIGDTDLKVSIGILLLQNNTNRLVDVNEKATRSTYALLVVRHSSAPPMQLVLEVRRFLGIVAMSE